MLDVPREQTLYVKMAVNNSFLPVIPDFGRIVAVVGVIDMII